MNIADFRDRIVCQQQVLTPDLQGGFAEDWQNIATVWAHVEQTASSPDVSARQRNLPRVFTVRVRHQDVLKTCRKILWQDQKLDVTGCINPDGRGKVLQFTCIEDLTS